MRFPTRIEAGDTADPLIYERVSDHFAVKVSNGGPLPGRAAGLIEGDPPLSIREGDPVAAGRADAAHLMPVFRLAGSGPLRVATGAVFARFTEGTDPAEEAAEIAAAGYEIASVPAYAPNAAWLRPRTGDTADALSGIERLRRMPNLVRIEPEMLSAAARKGRRES